MIRSRNFLVFAILTLLTLISWQLAKSQSGEITLMSGGIVMLLLAFFKVWLIMRNFMEVRSAPLPLRIACDVWILFAFSATALTYGAL